MSSPTPTNPRFCGSSDHDLSRRDFMGGLTAAGVMSALGTSGAVTAFGGQNDLNEALKQSNKRVILLWQAGGGSQLETWDPKPGRPTGGPFLPIKTDVPGTQISELMPEMAKRMKHTCVIRSMKTGDAGHGGGASLMMRGRKDEAAIKYPDIGAILSRELGRRDSQVPDYVSFYTATEGRGNQSARSSFLGPRYNAMALTTEPAPPNLDRLESVSEEEHHARASLQALLNERFLDGRKLSTIKSHSQAYARVHGLMSSQDLFDVSKEPQHIRDKYGPTLFGEQVCIARRMVEAGVPFVRISRAWWDSHGQNFETHQELVPEFDRVLSALIDDLKDRGMLDDVLIVTMGEFGRTPRINGSLGRDHFANAWSVAMAGCGVQGGAVYGVSDEDGNNVKENPVNAGDYFATICKAVGLDPHKEYHVGARPVPLVNPGHKAVDEVLA